MGSHKKPKEFSISGLLSVLAEGMRVHGRPGSRPGSFALPQYYRVIAALSGVSPEFSADEQLEIVRDVLNTVYVKNHGKLPEAAIRAELKKEAARRNAAPLGSFKFTGWIAKGPGELPRVVNWLGRRLTIDRGLPRECIPEFDRRHLAEVMERWPAGPLWRVRFSVQARSLGHAARIAECEFAEWRGVVDLIASFRRTHWLFDGLPTNPSAIPAFPVCVLQPESGEAISLYNVDDTIRFGKLLDANDIAMVRRFKPFVERGIRKHFRPSLLKDALRCYASAVETTNYEVTLQRLWKTLEILSDAHEGSEVISRIASLYKERASVSEQLRYYCELRNQIAHTTLLTDLDRVTTDALRVHVHQAIQIHLVKGHEVKDTQELFASINLALDSESLKRTKRLIASAAKEMKRRSSAGSDAH